MVFHLYVDESGKFSSLETNINVVGGILLPGEEARAFLPQDWNQHAREAGKKTPGVPADVLKEYDFEHCTENKTAYRWPIQRRMLASYLSDLRAAGGRPVFLYAGHDHLDVDSTTTYISVLTKGLIQLFALLREMYPGEAVKLYAHIAVREHTTMTVVTREEKKDKDDGRTRLSQADIKTRIAKYLDLLTSPTSGALSGAGVEEINITLEQYRKAIRHAAYLAASEDIFRCRDFSDMIRNLEILPNRFVKVRDVKSGTHGERVENSWTVVCDCLCNSFYHCFTGKYSLEEVFGGTDALQIEADLSASSLEKEDVTESYRNAFAARFLRLMHLSFPETETQQWLSRFNRAQAMHQRTFVSGVVAYFDALTYYHEDDQEVLDTITRTLRVIREITDESIRSELEANLHVFHYAIHTHLAMAREISEDIRLFHEAIARVKNKDAVSALMPVFLNRHMVLYTDRFDYDRAEAVFRRLERFWKATLEARSTLLEGGQELDEEYGKEIGSYLQLIRHKLRVEGDPELREVLYLDGLDLFAKALDHLPGKEDRSRIFQSMSGIEQEMGHWDDALGHLYRAAGSDPTQADAMETLWKAIGLPECRDPFLLAMLLRLVDCMMLSGEPRGRELLDRIQRLLKEAFPHISRSPRVEDPAFADGIHSLHPKVQVLWRFGSAAAASGEEGWPQGKRLLEAALEKLSGTAPGTYRAIAVAISAEIAGWSQVYGDKKSAEAVAAFREACRRFEGTYEEAEMKNPFGSLWEKRDSLNGPEDYFRLTRVIAY